MNKKISEKAVRIGALAVLWGAVLIFVGLRVRRFWPEPVFMLVNNLMIFVLPALSVWILGGKRLLRRDTISDNAISGLLAGNVLLFAGGICFVHFTIQTPLLVMGQSGGTRWEPPFYLRGVPLESTGPVITAVLWGVVIAFALLGVAAGILMMKSGMLLPLLYLDCGVMAYCVFIIWLLGEMSTPENLEMNLRTARQSLFFGVGMGVLCLAVLLWSRRKRVGRANDANAPCVM